MHTLMQSDATMCRLYKFILSTFERINLRWNLNRKEIWILKKTDDLNAENTRLEVFREFS